jgi:tyrosyl-tRNA synthetase
MLMGLKEGQEKMSKSDPDSAIFMEDAAEDVKRKVRAVQTSPVSPARHMPSLDSPVSS